MPSPVPPCSTIAAGCWAAITMGLPKCCFTPSATCPWASASSSATPCASGWAAPGPWWEACSSPAGPGGVPGLSHFTAGGFGCQFIKACGTIPSTYLASVLLSEALDDVHAKSGVRCDGFTSSLYNSMLTITSGLAVSLLNGGMALFGYLAPAAGAIPTQPQAVGGSSPSASWEFPCWPILSWPPCSTAWGRAKALSRRQKEAA